MQSNLFDLLQVPDISSQKNYWLVRSNGGKYYDDFIVHRYVAIAWDYISKDSFLNNSEADIKRIIEMKLRAMAKADIEVDDDPEEETTDLAQGIKAQVSFIFSKLNSFISDMQVGDIVLVPSYSSGEVSIGMIDGEVYEDNNYIENYLKQDSETLITLCPYYKRRKVKWIKKIPKLHMDVYLSKAFNSQHALSNMKEYAALIDRAIYPLYRRDNNVHATLHAGHPNGLTIKALANFLNNINDTIDDVAAQCGIEIEENDLQIKLNIHSPGLMEIIAYGIGAGISLSLVIYAINHFINGGTLGVSFKADKEHVDFSLQSETKGLRGRDLEGRRLDIKEQESLISAIRELDIKDSDDQNKV